MSPPVGELDAAIELARRGVTVATFGDLMRVPGTSESLSDQENVRVVQDVVQAVRLAEGREVVFFAVGFETTAPATAAILSEDPP